MPGVAAGALAAQKKSLSSSERNPYKRAWYWRRLAKGAVQRLKFLDETAVHTALTRRYGRAVPGTRVRESVPRNYGPSTFVISCVGWRGVEATMMLEGAVDTLAFNVYLERLLRPRLRAGDILILDNLSVHKASRVEAVAAAKGARVVWLPPYSPDFSPIEPMWAKVKEALRAAKARTREELEQA